MTQAYPLQWPAGQPRTRARATARFAQSSGDGSMKSATIATARERLQAELDRLDARNVTLSTNVELRVDGQPRSDRGDPADPGAAIYFTLRGKPTTLACDRWNRVADNIIALAKHIEALRGMNRWGVGTADQVFAGYQALPAPEQWWQVLGFASAADAHDRDAITRAYRARASAAHPDHPGGSNAAMSRLNAARDAALKEIGL